MTTITFTKTNNQIKVVAHDHAYGSQMVCNAVSVMMYTLEAWLLNNTDLVKHHVSDFKSGDASIAFIPNDCDVYTVLGFIIIGLAEIEHNYGRQFIALSVSDEIKSLTGVKF